MISYKNISNVHVSVKLLISVNSDNGKQGETRQVFHSVQKSRGRIRWGDVQIFLMGKGLLRANNAWKMQNFRT